MYESRCMPCSVEVPVEKGSPMLEAWLLSCFSCVQHFGTLWTVAHQAPLSMGFSRQEYWSGLPRPPPGDFPDPGIDPSSLMSSASAGGLFTTSTAWETLLDENTLKRKCWQSRGSWRINGSASMLKEVRYSSKGNSMSNFMTEMETWVFVQYRCSTGCLWWCGGRKGQAFRHGKDHGKPPVSCCDFWALSCVQVEITKGF